MMLKRTRVLVLGNEIAVEKYAFEDENEMFGRDEGGEVDFFFRERRATVYF